MLGSIGFPQSGLDELYQGIIVSVYHSSNHRGFKIDTPGATIDFVADLTHHSLPEVEEYIESMCYQTHDDDICSDLIADVNDYIGDDLFRDIHRDPSILRRTFDRFGMIPSDECIRYVIGQ